MADENTTEAAIITLIAETHVHPGIGQSAGALDLPVSRERVTQYPFVPGSGVKGACRVWAEEKAGFRAEADKLFGRASGPDSGAADGAGALLLSDARLLLLPVRCLTDAYKWVTCPAILRRLARDIVRAGYSALNWTLPAPEQEKYCGQGADGDWLGLEEREFKYSGGIDATVTNAIAAMIGPDMAEALTDKLVVLSDRDFTWFAQYALPIMARNVLDENKVSKNLWYEETLAPDSILYMLVGERKPGNLEDFTGAVGSHPYIQIGGNETIGQGWFRMCAYAGNRP